MMIHNPVLLLPARIQSLLVANSFKFVDQEIIFNINELAAFCFENDVKNKDCLFGSDTREMTKLETKGTMSQKWLNEQLERAWQERERSISYTVALQLTEAGRHEKRRKPKSRSLP
jgi:hypothetical protein